MTLLMRAAVLAALVFSGLPQSAAAQDVTLTSRDGALEISGQLQGYDGEFYRIDSSYGLLTVDAQGVICEGPACPDLTAPKSVIRVVGAPAMGAALMPRLVASFAATQGLTLTEPTEAGQPVLLTDPATDKVLAEFSFMPLDPAEAREALSSGRAELILAAATETVFGSRAIGLDPLVAIVAADNPTPVLSTPNLARALTGDVVNWKDLGGPDMPLVLHGLSDEADLHRALAARLGRKIAATVSHDSPEALAMAVARDPWALAVTGRSVIGAAKVIGLTDSCGFPLQPTSMAVKSEDYPLTLPIYFLTPRRRLPLVAREFLEFLALPPAQMAVEEAGFVGRGLARQPMTADGLRLINAIQGAGAETSLADLQGLVKAMQGADRLSFTFRFQDGGAELESHSRDSLADLARAIEAGVFAKDTLYLAGFSDGTGAAAANQELSLHRASQILAALQKAAPGLSETELPRVAAFGESLPMACDETAAGRRLNRRVEVWAKPQFLTNSPPSGN